MTYIHTNNLLALFRKGLDTHDIHKLTGIPEPTVLAEITKQRTIELSHKAKLLSQRKRRRRIAKKEWDE